MSRNLPGFYWDAEKNRYFPLSTKPANAHAPTTYNRLQQPINVSHETRWQVTRNNNESLDKALSACDTSSFRKVRGVLTSNIRRRYIDRALDALIYGPATGKSHGSIGASVITAFAKHEHESQAHFVVGDADGWVYMPGPQGIETPQDVSQEPLWTRQAFLMSKITAVCMEDDLTVATSFGPQSKFLLYTSRSPDQMILKSLPNDSVYDVRAASLDRGSLVLGASKKAAQISDLETGHIRFLRTDSDVLAVDQHHGLAYTGARNGAIYRFDQRDRTPGKLLFADERRISASITTLKSIRDHELLTARINGNISTYDLRFTRGTPIRHFHGHVCSYTTDLPLAQPLCVDPYERFLFVMGQDQHVRVWSISTGEELTHKTCIRHSNEDVLGATRGGSVHALQACGATPDTLSLVASISNELKEWSWAGWV